MSEGEGRLLGPRARQRTPWWCSGLLLFGGHGDRLRADHNCGLGHSRSTPSTYLQKLDDGPAGQIGMNRLNRTVSTAKLAVLPRSDGLLANVCNTAKLGVAV